MENDLIKKLQKAFEQAVHKEKDLEYWLARELQELLDYSNWQNFIKVVEKAMLACSNSGQSVDDHFIGVNKMVTIGSGAERKVNDILLTRYACYLIAQNGDPRKEQIAFAMTYFALQTRKQELLEKRINEVERLKARKKLSQTEKELSGILYERGVNNRGFGRIQLVVASR